MRRYILMSLIFLLVRTGTAFPQGSVCGDAFGATIHARSSRVTVGRSIALTTAVFGGGAPYSITWMFSDGSSDSGYSVAHAFEVPGIADATANVRDSCGSTRSATISLQVLGYSANPPDSLVILGAGRVGDWATEIELANPTDTEQFGTIATVTTPNQLEGCPGACIYRPYHLSPNGTTTVTLAGGLGAPEFVGAYYVVPDGGGILPVAAARVLHGGVSSHSLPVFRMNTLLQSFAPNPFGESGPEVLLGARRSGTTHSNLLLSVLQPPGTVDHTGVPLRVDLLDGSGALVGTHDYRLGFGESRVIGDVVGALGVDSLDLGQIRVTQTGGTNIVRAALATVLDGGAVTVTSGLLPELGPIPDPAFDSATIVGAGAIGDWDTEILLGDSIHFATDNILSTSIPVRGPICEVWVGDSATLAVAASDISCFDPGSNLVYATAAGHASEAAARIFDRSRPWRSADLPVVLTRQLVGIDLVFPFRAGRQNLFLAEESGFGAVTAHVEVRNSDGAVLGSIDQHIPAGGRAVLANVLAAAGVGDTTAGQIRVTSTGDGFLRGALATLGDDGSFVVTPGANP